MKKVIRLGYRLTYFHSLQEGKINYAHYLLDKLKSYPSFKNLPAQKQQFYKEMVFKCIYPNNTQEVKKYNYYFQYLQDKNSEKIDEIIEVKQFDEIKHFDTIEKIIFNHEQHWIILFEIFKGKFQKQEKDLIEGEKLKNEVVITQTIIQMEIIIADVQKWNDNKQVMKKKIFNSKQISNQNQTIQFIVNNLDIGNIYIQINLTMQTSPLRRVLFRNMYTFFGLNKTGGNLYTWGMTSIGSGIDQEVQPDQLVPRKLDFFKGDVAKVSTGLNSTAVISTKGILYTFGCNKYGQLGLGNKTDTYTPTEVTYFRENGLKVDQVAMGTRHAVAVTTDGSVYTWGSAGNQLPLLSTIFPNPGALGHPSNQNQLTPQLLESLRGKVKPQTITAGKEFSILQDAENNIWNWGLGSLGQAGNGYQENLQFPELNPFWQKLSKNNHIVKIKSAADGTVALLKDGTLLGWGGNNFGQLGIREQEFVRTDGKNPIPKLVNRKYMQPNEKVVDFDLSRDNLVFYTDQNNVYYSGNEEYYVPYRVELPTNDKVIKVAATTQSFAILTETGDLYVSNQFVEPFEKITQSVVFKVPRQDIFNGSKIIDIGGTYSIRYAVVEP